MGRNYLREALDEVRRGEQEVIIRADPSADATTRVADYFEPFNIDIGVEPSEGSDERKTVVLREDGSVVATSDLEWIDEYLTCLRMDDVAGDHAPPVLNHIDTRTFTSMNVRRMVLASREIETMAHRVGEGTLHSGFQKLSRVRTQTSIYRKLVDAGLDVHIYGVDDGPDVSPELASLLSSTTVRCEPSPELAESWFVLFTSEETTAGMFAVATEPGEKERFDGCWTYREDLIRRMGDHLSERYEARPIPN
jgi:DICT domain-containing protein